VEFLRVRFVEIEEKEIIPDADGIPVKIRHTLNILPARALVIDDASFGHTNEVLELEAGTHRIALEPDENLDGFHPRNVKIKLINTNLFAPMEVYFEKISL